MKTKLNLHIAIVILIILHAVGIAGLMSDYNAIFLSLTPLNLLISLGLLVYFQQQRDIKFYSIMTFIMLTGFILEIVGINTGYPFGDYSYGKTLGPQLLGTPYMIGVNWFFMAYCGALLMRNVTPSIGLNAILTGIIITLFDFIMEPVAIHLGFWNWSGDNIPIQNYLTWIIATSIYALIIFKYLPNAQNPIAKWVLGIQFFFFLILYLLITL